MDNVTPTDEVGRAPRTGEAWRESTLDSPAERCAWLTRRTARLTIAADAVALSGVAILVLAGMRVLGNDAGLHIGTVVGFALATTLVLGAFGLYGPRQLSVSCLDGSRQTATALACSALGVVLVYNLVDPGGFGRVETVGVLVWLPAAFMAVTLTHWAVRHHMRRAHPERILIVGAGGIGQSLAKQIMTADGRTASVVGFVDDDPLPLGDGLHGIPVFPESTGLNGAIAATGATRLVIAFSRRSADEVLETIRTSEFGPLPISVVPRYFEITPSHATFSEVGGVPVLNLSSAQLSRGARITKRALDLAVASAALIVLSPVLAACAIGIKLTSPGPVFFRQERLGHRGKPFHIWKFRTMVKDAESLRMQLAHLNEMVGSGPLFKIKADPRITRIGGFLRRTSLDELPQLLNVIRGEMSLVGPRPFVTHEAVQMRGWSARRLDLIPGITGLWQVRGRNEVPYEEMIRLDYMYVTNWSVWWDVRLLLQTIPRILTGKGAS